MCVTDWAVYCGTSQYCNTLGQFLECCTSMTTAPTTLLDIQTVTSTVRNSYTTTFMTTYSNTNEYHYQLFGCGGYSACHNSTTASSCTGACTSTALVCTYEDAPYCASVYMETYLSDQSTSGTSGIATSWFCDTAAYGLTYANWGNWPSRLSTYTTIYNETSTSAKPTWTPTVVPFSQTQASRPVSAATIPNPTSTSGASCHRQTTNWSRMMPTCIYSLFCIFFLV